MDIYALIPPFIIRMMHLRDSLSHGGIGLDTSGSYRKRDRSAETDRSLCCSGIETDGVCDGSEAVLFQKLEQLQVDGTGNGRPPINHAGIYLNQ